ncbi:MAG TPA: NAD(P)H-dependent oxidoreductase [Longimicrobiales bacterium]|nr:NAD(P)H-dependent oxidoreductase [Longimicrobiales bacterium]
MKRILILFAHPTLEKSRVHRRLVQALPALPGLTLNDLYEHYPDFDIDVRREQGLLMEHDVILMQHPFFWYSTPPILKQWQDLVLEHGWAYGSAGTALRGKDMLSVISAGGPMHAYHREGHNRFTVRELLAPVEQTARLCGMRYLPPWVVWGSHRLDEQDIAREAERFRDLVTRLHHGDLDIDAAAGLATLNDAHTSVPAEKRA